METPGQNLFHCFFQFLQAIHIPWLVPTSLKPHLSGHHYIVTSPLMTADKAPLLLDWTHLDGPGHSSYFNIFNHICKEFFVVVVQIHPNNLRISVRTFGGGFYSASIPSY